MKKIKEIIKSLCYRPIIGNIIFIIAKIFGQKVYQERIIKIRKEKEFFRSVNFNKTVQRGPFQGLTYPTLESTCSEIAPKIIGTYEMELFEAIEDMCKSRYKVVVDVGCAEGYYAVGFAKRIPSAEVFAFDINRRALEMCRKLAEENKVSERVHLQGFCDSKTLASFDFKNSGLIICDCEGYELELFNEESIRNLLNCDLLIELHDILIPGLRDKLLPRFKNTHSLSIIKVLDRDGNLYPELQSFSEDDKKIILSEFREGLYGEGKMEWAYLKAN